MITFTPLSGSAHSQDTSPLAYLLQVDDVRILLDCGSPDWRPEPSFSTENCEKYCQSIRQCVSALSASYFQLDLCFKLKGSRRPSTSSSYHTGIWPMPVCSPTRSVDGVSGRRVIAPSPSKLLPVFPSRRTSKGSEMSKRWTTVTWEGSHLPQRPEPTKSRTPATNRWTMRGKQNHPPRNRNASSWRRYPK